MQMFLSTILLTSYAVLHGSMKSRVNCMEKVFCGGAQGCPDVNLWDLSMV